MLKQDSHNVRGLVKALVASNRVRQIAGENLYVTC